MTKISASKPRWGGGRPKLKKEELRKSHGVRLSELELIEAHDRAAEAGVNFSRFCRNAILNATTPRPVPPINLKAWLELAALAKTIDTLARDDEGKTLAQQLTEVRVLLVSMRMSLLGLHETPDDQS